MCEVWTYCILLIGKYWQMGSVQCMLSLELENIERENLTDQLAMYTSNPSIYSPSINWTKQFVLVIIGPFLKSSLTGKTNIKTLKQ